MRRQLALFSEILARLYNACAKNSFPKAIDRNPRGQRVFGTDKPSRQRQAIRRLIGGQRRQNRRHAGRDFFAFVQEVAAHVNISRSRLSAFFHH